MSFRRLAATPGAREMERNPIQFLPSRSSQFSRTRPAAPPAIAGDLGRGAGKVHLQDSETGLWAPGSGGFTEEVTLDPGALKDKREFVAAIGQTEGPAKEGPDCHQKLWAEPWPGGPETARHRTLSSAQFGEQIRPVPQSLQLCQCRPTGRSPGRLPETRREPMWPLWPDSAGQRAAAWG